MTGGFWGSIYFLRVRTMLMGPGPDTSAGMLRLDRFTIWIVLFAKPARYLNFLKGKGNRILGQIPTLVCSDSSDCDLSVFIFDGTYWLGLRVVNVVRILGCRPDTFAGMLRLFPKIPTVMYQSYLYASIYSLPMRAGRLTIRRLPFERCASI
jgi:hypothetical protein